MRIGLDIGSTTIKLVALDDTLAVRAHSYRRHGGRIAEHVRELLSQTEQALGDTMQVQLAVSGSAGMGFAEACSLPFVQEVHATRVAARRLAPDADVIIELGGEDAKVLFMREPMDARMNGSCAGGTGAFIDQMATLLGTTPEGLDALAAGHERVYTIASRCGVFAKSDVQPLLGQGARAEDIAASILYSVVNQTVSGLAQGRPLEGNILYLGGPLTFLASLRAAFDRVLKLTGTLPENSLYYVAMGTALSAEATLSLAELAERFQRAAGQRTHRHTAPLFQSGEAYDAFARRHASATVRRRAAKGFVGDAHLGIDAGSTTIKTALIDAEGALLDTTYAPSGSGPVPRIREVLKSLYERMPGMTLRSVTVTGYGEQLVRDAFHADFGVIETMAHYLAARRFMPEVDFIIDIGGQDMKCFRVVDGAIGDIYLNEACSSGCGSFLQTFAEAMGEDIETFSKQGLFADRPVDLGSRCTVFMNSSVKQAQKDGASLENISAGLSVSVVKNALYKVIRAPGPEAIGRHVVVQGGTFLNDAVLRAFEMELGFEVVRPEIAGLMGAYGAALYGQAQAAMDGDVYSRVLTRQQLASFGWDVKAVHCNLCANRCLLTINSFSDGRRSISGNRCDKPTQTGDGAPESLNLYAYKRNALASLQPGSGRRGTIGIPMVLNLYETLPFWHALLTALDFAVVTSPPSSRALYFEGQRTIPSDTVCYPAKLAHGHLSALSNRADVDAIFYPCLTYNIDENLGDNHYNCPVVAYYPETLKSSGGDIAKPFLMPYLGIHRPKDFAKRFHRFLSAELTPVPFGEVKRAVAKAYGAYEKYLADIRAEGERIIDAARSEGRPVLVLAGRPYHIDGEINHGIDALMLRYGAAVVSEDAVCMLGGKGPTSILNQWTYHARLFAAARYVAGQENMNLVQLISFGCGLDAVTGDEVREILGRSGKLYTQIKIDEIANLGAVNIRLRSLFAAAGQMRPKEDGGAVWQVAT